MKKIDTHLHLIYPDQLNYPWISEVPPLQGDFSIGTYHKAAEGCEIESAIFMEVDVSQDQAGEEVSLVRELAADPQNRISGIIGAARPEDRDFQERLEQMDCPELKGIRRVLHTQPDELSQGSLFRENLRRLATENLSFDLCVLQRQLPIGIELVDACPEVTFVLDHCGVPEIAADSFDSWSKDIGLLAQRENVFCKISGLPTYCAPEKTGPEYLRKWVERVVECFGWDRVVWGGDWPVCTLNSSFGAWVDSVDRIFESESEGHRAGLYRENARTIYGL